MVGDRIVLTITAGRANYDNLMDFLTAKGIFSRVEILEDTASADWLGICFFQAIFSIADAEATEVWLEYNNFTLIGEDQITIPEGQDQPALPIEGEMAE